MEDLIGHAGVIFEESGTDSHSAPLPAAPDEPAPKYDYGSSFTQVTSLPPRDYQHGKRESGDFTPQLPSRPESSIHPASRRAARSIASDSETTDLHNSPKSQRLSFDQRRSVEIPVSESLDDPEIVPPTPITADPHMQDLLSATKASLPPSSSTNAQHPVEIPLPATPAVSVPVDDSTVRR